MLCARSQSCLRIVTGCGCGSETGNFSLLRRNFSWGEVHEYGMPRTKDFALRTNPGWALIQILRSSTTLRLQCVRVYVRVVMQKGVREREKERGKHGERVCEAGAREARQMCVMTFPAGRCLEGETSAPGWSATLATR